MLRVKFLQIFPLNKQKAADQQYRECSHESGMRFLFRMEAWARTKNWLSGFLVLFCFNQCFVGLDFLLLFFQISLLELNAMIDDPFDNLFRGHCVAWRTIKKRQLALRIMGIVMNDVFTWIDQDEFSHCFWYCVRIFASIFQRDISLSMAHDINFEMIHQIIGDWIWSPNHHLVHILTIRKRTETVIQ